MRGSVLPAPWRGAARQPATGGQADRAARGPPVRWRGLSGTACRPSPVPVVVDGDSDFAQAALCSAVASKGGLAVVIQISVESRRVGLDAARESRAHVAGTEPGLLSNEIGKLVSDEITDTSELKVSVRILRQDLRVRRVVALLREDGG